MNVHALPLAQRAAELRRRFDRSFAEPLRGQQAAPLDLLAIGLAGDAYALRLSGVAGVFAGKTLTRLPGDVPECLGIAGFRGTIVPVFDLRLLLGCVAGGAPRWLAMVARSPVALAFDTLDGSVRVAAGAISSQGQGESLRPHVRELVRDGVSGSPLRWLIDLDAVVSSIRQRVRPPISSPQE